MEDFRQTYDFDAYLLGYSDDVARALAKELFPSSQDGSFSEAPSGELLPELDGSLLETNTESGFSVAGYWSEAHVPRDRVFLFPGAQSCNGDDASKVSYHEIANCDACSKRIHGKIRKCLACFDFDLCGRCYPAASKKHFGGKHRFSTEDAAAS